MFRSALPRRERRGQRGRSEERRVGKECRSRWSPCHSKKKYAGSEEVLREEVGTRDEERRHSSLFFFSSRRRHTRLTCDWSSDVALPIWAAWGSIAAWTAWFTVGAGDEASSR